MIPIIYAFRRLPDDILRWNALTAVSRVRKESSILKEERGGRSGAEEDEELKGM